jgi:hypothetical protein
MAIKEQFYGHNLSLAPWLEEKLSDIPTLFDKKGFKFEEESVCKTVFYHWFITAKENNKKPIFVGFGPSCTTRQEVESVHEENGKIYVYTWVWGWILLDKNTSLQMAIFTLDNIVNPEGLCVIPYDYFKKD